LNPPNPPRYATGFNKNLYTKALTGVLKGSRSYVDVKFVVRSIVMLMKVRSVLTKEMYRADNITEL